MIAPMPRTQEKIAEFEAHIDELRQRLTQAQDTLERNRARSASNP
jgi:peptidoglycan hydrolase CwlO-like protein